MLNKITDSKCEIAFEEDCITLCKWLCQRLSKDLQINLMQWQTTYMKCEHQEECLERYYTLAWK